VAVVYNLRLGFAAHNIAAYHSVCVHKVTKDAHGVPGGEVELAGHILQPSAVNQEFAGHVQFEMLVDPVRNTVSA
jgi:hypothetical protein